MKIFSWLRRQILQKLSSAWHNIKFPFAVYTIGLSLFFQLPLKLLMYNISFEDIVQFMYKDTSVEKSIAISTALQSDWSLREKFKVLNESRELLPKVRKSPRPQTIDAIMAYAEARANKLALDVE